MKEEFIEAYNRLKEDPQPVNLTLPKPEAWLLLTPIQLASKHSHAKKSYVIQEAIKVAKAIHTLIVGDSETLAEVARAGWEGREPKISLKRFEAETRSISSEEITIQISKEQAWCIIAASQLAHRHPQYMHTKAAESNKKILDILATAIPEGILSMLAKSGWDTRFDQPIKKKGFGKA